MTLETCFYREKQYPEGGNRLVKKIGFLGHFSAEKWISGSQDPLQVMAELAAPNSAFAAIHDHFIMVGVVVAQFFDAVDVDHGRAVDADHSAVLQFFFNGSHRLPQQEQFPAALDPDVIADRFDAFDLFRSEE